MLLAFLWPFAIGILAASATTPTPTRRQEDLVSSDKFVSVTGSQFHVNGSEFRFVGTNAYWLQTLNDDTDIINTFRSIKAANISVVRTWAFNDVEVIPDDNSTWFQLIANGTTTVNNGTNGLPKLDRIIQHAENFGIYLMLTLTNNWNPRPLFDNLTESIENLTSTVETIARRDVSQGTNNTLPRNTLSNDYGGMDVYVRQFGLTNHDDFYLNETIISAFENYTKQVVSRYVNSPAVLAWEVANDPRCNSSIAASPVCNTTTVTHFIDRVSQVIKAVDPNHLVTSGNQGFFCDNCQKLFPRTPSKPQTSAAPGKRRSVPVLTKRKLEQEKRERRKKRDAIARASRPANGPKIRGMWAAPAAVKRQDSAGVSSVNDGSQGVDSEDIINIPQIGFGTFQLFPDQDTYGLGDPNLPAFNQTVEIGVDWIKQQAAVSQLFGKPITLTGFGLVTQANAPFFVPFNTSIAPFGLSQDNASSTTTNASTTPFGVTDQQRDDAYSQWIQAGIGAGLQGLIQYQWAQGNLTAVNGSAIQATAQSPTLNTTSQSQNLNTTGESPNDGYSIQGVGQGGVQSVLQGGEQAIGT